jgi:hypothetical protein
MLADLVTGVGEAPRDVVANPYGQVPVFHWPNRRIHWYGVGELLDVIPLQDALNKAGATCSSRWSSRRFGSGG